MRQVEKERIEKYNTDRLREREPDRDRYIHREIERHTERHAQTAERERRREKYREGAGGMQSSGNAERNRWTETEKQERVTVT